MTTEPERRNLFQVFFLEDDPELGDDLRILLSASLPGVAVVWARTIDDGLRLLTPNADFDLGLLDVKVPYRTHEQPETHPEVVNALRHRAVPILIYTGFVSSDDVREYLSRNLSDPPLAVIPKNVGEGNFDQIVTTIRNWFIDKASERIRRSLETIFETNVESGFSYRGTGALLSLQQDIVDYWQYLNGEARALVARRFRVQIHDNEVSDLTLTPWCEPQ